MLHEFSVFPPKEMRMMERPESTLPTPRQQEILDWVKAFIRDHGMPPTVREIGGAFEIKSSSVFDLLKALENKGCLRRGGLGARSLIVEDHDQPHECDCMEVRVVGRVRAGAPIDAIEIDCGTITVKRDLLRGREAFALEVNGNSMVEAGILDGDFVVVRKQTTADDGDIVVALIENEATLKRFYRDAGGVRLEPANCGMPTIHVRSGDFAIQGTVVSVMRMMDRTS
jgi:repressor LexA